MAKKSRRRPSRYEKDQTGCIAGLIRIFDFRNGRSTRKLLSDRRMGNKQAVGTGSSHTKPMLADCDIRLQENEVDIDSGMTSTDIVTTSVKKLMEDEMYNDSNDPGAGLEKRYPERVHAPQARRNYKHSNKASKRSNEIINLCDSDAEKDLGSDKSCDQFGSKSTSDRFDFEIIMHLLHDDFDQQSDLVSAVDKGKLSAAIKIFIDQSSSDSKHFIEDGQTQHSQEFRDALRRLTSNRELLLKLLDDPKRPSPKQINGLEGAQLREDLRSNSLPRSGFLGEKLAHSKADELISHKQSRKFFRRRSKSQESFPSMGTENCQHSRKIVILKPGPAALPPQDAESDVNAAMQSRVGSKIQEDRSHFSFTEFKRKLKQAITRERQGTSHDGINHKAHLEHLRRRDFDKGVAGENPGWRSPNRNHFYVERFAKPSITTKKGDKIGKPNEIEETIATKKSDQTIPGVSNIYIEAKKHLVEMLNSGEYDTEFKSQQLPRSLGRILSFSEYYYSPNYSPRKINQDISVNEERTLSSCSGIEIVNEAADQSFEESLNNNTSPFTYNSEIELCSTHVNSDEKLECVGAKRNLPSEHSDTKFDEKTLSLAGDVTVSIGAAGFEVTTNDTQEDNELHSGQSCSYNKEGGEDSDFDEQFEEDRLMQSLKMETLGECQTSSSPSLSPSSSKTSVTIKVEDLEGATDRTERPSPVSVLEPLFVEDDISPARAISRPVEPEIQPRRIHFEEWRSSDDQGICAQTSLEDEESAFEYVEAVLLGSGLNWDEYLLRWLSSSSILESSLYDEVELFSNRSLHEQKLLFDCTNEALEEVCDHYFGSFPLASHTKQNVRQVPVRMNLIREIWEGVEWHLLQYPPPQSLDQLLKKDMAKPRKWMNLRLHTQHIGEEMEETIVDNLIEDTISCLISGALETDLVAS